jgi:hypothetical protein
MRSLSALVHAHPRDVLRRAASVAVLISLALLLAMPALAATGDPLPGVDILVRKKPGPKPTKLHFGGGGAIAIEADAFFPGSGAFSGDVDLQLDSADGFGTIGHVDHGRLRCAEGSSPNILDVEMTSMTLRSINPILIDDPTAGTVAEDAWVDIAALGGGATDPIGGEIDLPAGTVVDAGSTHPIVDGFVDVLVTVTFVDSVSGNPSGPTLQTTLRLSLDEVDLPLTRLSASEGGNVVPGYDGTTLFDYTLVSGGGELTLGLDSELPQAPVPNEAKSFGALKQQYR